MKVSRYCALPSPSCPPRFWMLMWPFAVWTVLFRMSTTVNLQVKMKKKIVVHRSYFWLGQRLLAQQMMSAACAAAFSSAIMNPLDIARTRIQVAGMQTNLTATCASGFLLPYVQCCSCRLFFIMLNNSWLVLFRKLNNQTGNCGGIPRGEDPRSQRRFSITFERSIIPFLHRRCMALTWILGLLPRLCMAVPVATLESIFYEVTLSLCSRNQKRDWIVIVSFDWDYQSKVL